jgi:putative copper export protein
VSHTHLFFHAFVRWLDFIALVSLVGGLSYRQFVLVPLFRDFPGNADRSFRLLMAAALLTMGATSTLDLAFRSLMMSGQPLSGLVSVLPTVLLETHFGRVWSWRAVLLLLLFGFWFLQHGPRPWIRGYMVSFVGVGLCLVTSLSGHAADRGIFTLTVLSDWVHLMAISSWVGGLFIIRLHPPQWLISLKGDSRIKCLAAIIGRFSTVAVTSVGVLLATGLYNTYVHVHSLPLLFEAPYGRILMVKWSLLMPMLVLGAVSRLGILPLLQEQEGKSRTGFLTRMITGRIKVILDNTNPLSLEKFFFRLILIEAVLGLGILGCSAWMTQLPPPHQVSFGMSHH